MLYLLRKLSHTQFCRCSDQYICLKCVNNPENTKPRKCPFCRRQLNKQMITDYNKRMKRAICVILSFVLSLLLNILVHIIFKLREEPQKQKKLEKYLIQEKG